VKRGDWFRRSLLGVGERSCARCALLDPVRRASRAPLFELPGLYLAMGATGCAARVAQELSS
jgi:hypothetical protein